MEWPHNIRAESYSLFELNRAGCDSVPRAHSIIQYEQDNSGWVPGGLRVAMCIDKAPGEDLSRVWKPYKLSHGLKVKIRGAFQYALK